MTGLSLRAVAGALALAALGVGACTSDSPPPAGRGPSATRALLTPPTELDATPSSAPRRGGTIKLGVVGAPATLDPYSPLASDLTYALARGLYRSLYRFDPAGEPRPDLARKIVATEHGVHVFLRRSLWSDGSLVTATDVLSSIERARAPSGFARITSAHAVSPRLLALKGEVGDWPRALATLSFVVPNGLPGLGHGRFVGAGPFRVSSYVPGLRVVYERNRHASIHQRSYVNKIGVEFVESESVLLELLAEDRLDAAVPPSTVNLGDRLEEMDVESASALGWESLRLELEPSLTRDERAAVIAPIDRKAIDTGLIRHAGRVSRTLHPGPGAASGRFGERVGARMRVNVPVKLASPSGDELLNLIQHVLQIQLTEAHVAVEPVNTSVAQFYGEWRLADPADVRIVRAAGAPGLRDGRRQLRDLTAFPLAQVRTYLAWRPGIEGLVANPTFEGPLWNAQRWWRSD